MLVFLLFPFQYIDFFMYVCVSFSDMQHTCQLDHQLSIWVPLWIVKLFMVFFTTHSFGSCDCDWLLNTGQICSDYIRKYVDSCCTFQECRSKEWWHRYNTFLNEKLLCIRKIGFDFGHIEAESVADMLMFAFVSFDFVV